ncbi:chromatin-remodelling complex, RSC SWI/SNF subunit Rsc7/Swp82, partial [Thamnocephalis sphaerospora]
DKAGEAKIDANGKLLDGREFDFPVFTLPTRHPTRLYAMSITIARLLGYRDSNHLFVANSALRRIPSTQEERDRLVDQGLVRTRLRQRPINIISTRALFRHFGHTILKRGRRVHDDYYCTGE